jgi:hypothetical protein
MNMAILYTANDGKLHVRIKLHRQSTVIRNNEQQNSEGNNNAFCSVASTTSDALTGMQQSAADRNDAEQMLANCIAVEALACAKLYNPHQAIHACLRHNTCMM